MEELIACVDSTGSKNVVQDDIQVTVATNGHNPVSTPHKERIDVQSVNLKRVGWMPVR